MIAVAQERVSGRSLTPPGLFERLVNRIAATEGLDRRLAERVVDQTAAWAEGADCEQGGAPPSCGDDGRGGNPPDCGHAV